MDYLIQTKSPPSYIITLNLLGLPDMGSFRIIVVKLYSYIDSDVRKIKKTNIFTIILDTGVRR